MKIIEFKKYENVPGEKKLNKKKMAILAAALAVVLIIAIIFSIYVCNRNFRNFMDKYILRKSVKENSLPCLEIKNIENMNIFAYDKYVVTLEKNRLKHYNSSGNESSDLEINVI